MKKKFTLIEIKPNIFLLDFKNYYDMAMSFVRYQEFYESASPRFRGKIFSILDFMEWYSKKYGDGDFIYPSQWSGYNLPGDVIKQVWDLGIYDRNIYDYEMKDIYDQCIEKSKKFYLIGAVGKDKDNAIKHEIAHGFFYTIPEYRKEMTCLVKSLEPNFRKQIHKRLKAIGYTPKVYIDECQAYLSTGLIGQFDILLKQENVPFVKLYNEYYKK